MGRMNKKKYNGWEILYIVLIFITYTIFIMEFVVHDKTYKDGQIDALNDKWKYEMQIKQDTTYGKIKAVNKSPNTLLSDTVNFGRMIIGDDTIKIRVVVGYGYSSISKMSELKLETK